MKKHIHVNHIILASSSPRRKEILEKLGLKFDICTSDIDENIEGHHTPIQTARKLAFQKALAVQNKTKKTSSIIIAADTIVVINRKILGKPKSKKQALKMLSLLSGKTHLVITGLCVIQGKERFIRHEITKVTLHHPIRKTLLKYIDTGEPMDKAGAYAIQGIGSFLIKKIDGDYFNVVGLPIGKLSSMLAKLGVQLF